MDIYYLLGYIVFFILPPTTLAIAIWFLEDVDTTTDDDWRFKENDPTRYIAYKKDKTIRPWFKPSVFAVCMLADLFALGYLIWFA